ncbi:MAG: DUF2497 domain-containing protein [Hyphomicrobiaceae bacterium]|nr:DUF2497 domain-containing protein [Hyphomicrobiaceae bacterium]
MTDDHNSAACSMEEILAEIRRTAAERTSVAMPGAGEGAASRSQPVFDVTPANTAMGAARDLEDSEAGSDFDPPSEFEGVANTASSHDEPTADSAAADIFDLPAILKPRQSADVRPLRPSSSQRLTDALRSAGLLADAAPHLPAASRAPAENAEAQRVSPASRSRGVQLPAATMHGDRAYIDIRSRRGARNDGGLRPHQESAVESSTDAEARITVEAGEALVNDAVALASALEVDLNRRRMRIMTGSGGRTPRRAEDERAARHAAAQDSAAELLRPMIRQWIAENMPRIVESALHMEVADGLNGARYNPRSEMPTP